MVRKRSSSTSVFCAETSSAKSNSSSASAAGPPGPNNSGAGKDRGQACAARATQAPICAPCLMRLALVWASSPGRAQGSVRARAIALAGLGVVVRPTELLDDVHEDPLGARGFPDPQGLKDCLERARGIASGGQHTSQTVQPIDVPGPDLQELPVNGDGLVQPPLVLEHGAKIVQRPGEARREGKRPADTGFCFLELALLPQHGAEIVMRPGNVRLQGKRAADAGFALVELPFRRKRGAQIVERLGIVRLQGKRLAITGHRLVQLVPLKEHDAEIVVRAGQVGLKGQRPAIAGLGLFQFPCSQSALPRLLCAAARSGFEGEHLAVAGDGLIQASRLMMPDSLRKYAPDVRRPLASRGRPLSRRFAKDRQNSP